MKKALTFFLILFIMHVSASVSFAQSDTERWVCLQAEHCWKEPNSCSTAHKGNGHVAKLSSKAGFEPIPGIDTYVVVCIATANDQICTTGNAAADMTVYGKNNLETLQTTLQFKFEGLFKADGTTAVANPAQWSGPYEWGDSLPQGHMHKWLAMNYYNPTLFQAGGAGGQQQGTFDFETAEKDCVSISWDPYGRVFDAGTLEPLTGATVTLFVKKGTEFKQMMASDLPGGNLINPQTTPVDGNFSFVVPDGDYKLMVAPAAVTDIANVDVNYTKAYFDIYPALTGDVIQQKGTIQHRDIPTATAGTSTTPQMMEYFYSADANGGVTVQGRVSHPLSKLIAKTSKIMAGDPNSKIPYRTVGTFTADKWGKFTITLDQNKFEETPEYIEVFSDLEIQKVDLRQPTTKKNGENALVQIVQSVLRLLEPQAVQAQSKTSLVKFEPIPQFLEGYAYDANGKPMPNAIVGVYLTISKKPYVQTTADATGHFIFQPELLPHYAYTLKYTSSTGQVVEAKTSKFLAQNQTYIVQNKINPFVVKDTNNQKRLVAAGMPTTSPSSPTQGGSGGSAAGGTTKTGGSGTGTTAGGQPASGKSGPIGQNAMSPIILIVTLLIVLVGGAAGGILLYMKKKQTVPPQW